MPGTGDAQRNKTDSECAFMELRVWLGEGGRTDKHILQKMFNAMKGMCRVPGGGTWAGRWKADGASDFSEEATVKQTKILDMRQREPGKEGVISG